MKNPVLVYVANFRKTEAGKDYPTWDDILMIFNSAVAWKRTAKFKIEDVRHTRKVLERLARLEYYTRTHPQAFREGQEATDVRIAQAEGRIERAPRDEAWVAYSAKTVGRTEGHLHAFKAGWDARHRLYEAQLPALVESIQQDIYATVNLSPRVLARELKKLLGNAVFYLDQVDHTPVAAVADQVIRERIKELEQS